MAKLTPEEKKLQHEFFEIWQKLCPMSSEALSEVFDILEEYNIHLGGGSLDDWETDPEDEELVREILEEVEAEIRAAQENQ